MTHLRAIGVCAALGAAALGTACTPEAQLTQSGCLSCHRPDGEGLEIPHARFALRCEDCHGGDPAQSDKDAAHVANPTGIGVVEGLSAGELRQLDQEYLRFLNPAHPSAVNQSCGSGSPQAAAGAGCHQSIVDTVRLSTHATAVGILSIPRFDRGIQGGRPPAKAAAPTVNQTFQSSTAPRFTYSGLDGLALTLLDGADPSDPRPYADHYQTKQCAQCHLQVYGGGVEPGADGLYRGVGCAACHMPYGHDGLSQSEGPNVDKSAPSHAEKHQLIRNPPVRACETCHNRSNRVGLQFQGWREASAQDDLPRAQTNPDTTFGRPPGAYVIDEDTRNDLDETPPDLHYAGGMTCIDCHVGTDVHGDGNIWSGMGAEVGVECQDCHGTFEAPVTEVEGFFRTTKGSRLERMTRAEDGAIQLQPISGGDPLPVVQVSALPDGDLVRGSHDAAAHGALECYACHTQWMQYSLRTDQVLDLRAESRDPIEGLQTPGVTSEVLQETVLDRFVLGVNVDGQVGPFLADHAMFTVIEGCETGTSSCADEGGAPGRRVVDQWLGASSEGRIGLSWRPAVPHTVGGAGATKTCDACHPTAGGENRDAVRAVYGFGDGTRLFTEPATGRTVDLLRFVDDAGTSTTALGTLLARPLEPERVNAALAVEAP